MNGPPRDGSGGRAHPTASANHSPSQRNNQPAQFSNGDQQVASRQVSWWPVREFLESVLSQANVGTLPWAGSPAWCELADGDPRKLLALAVDGEHHVLRKEVAQQQRCEAAKDVAGAADWKAIASEIRGRLAVYIPRTGVA